MAWEPMDKVAFLQDYNNGDDNDTLAEKHDTSRGRVIHYLRYLRDTENLEARQPHRTHHVTKPEEEAPATLPVEVSVGSDGSKTDRRLVNKDVRSIAELVELYQIDTTEWEVVRFRCKTGSWDGFWKDSDNNAHTKTLYRYACEAELKPVRQDIKDTWNCVREIIESIRDYAPHYKTIHTHPFRHHEHCLQIDIPDLHMGKLAWGEETGGPHYDVNIAEELFLEAVESALRFGQLFDLGTILFPIGNDLLNSDNSENTTTKGTPQSTDGRQKKTFRRTFEMLVKALEMCSQIAPVKALIVPGNHDRDTSFYLGMCLDAWFHNNPDVEIDNRACHMKAFQWGENGILLTHGEEREGDLALTFASDYPEMWAATSYHEVQCGHIHRTKVVDYRGCNVRYIGSLTAPDFWHATKNYKSRRTAAFYVWQLDGRESYAKNFNAPPDKVLIRQQREEK